ncbi:MAG: hypothetical protein GY774_09885 [Planctomycetes bacterium]|nr:hypothetical protein [Planctomycetota bacterium]
MSINCIQLTAKSGVSLRYTLLLAASDARRYAGSGEACLYHLMRDVKVKILKVVPDLVKEVFGLACFG